MPRRRSLGTRAIVTRGSHRPHADLRIDVKHGECDTYDAIASRSSWDARRFTGAFPLLPSPCRSIARATALPCDVTMVARECRLAASGAKGIVARATSTSRLLASAANYRDRSLEPFMGRSGRWWRARRWCGVCGNASPTSAVREGQGFKDLAKRVGNYISRVERARADAQAFGQDEPQAIEEAGLSQIQGARTTQRRRSSRPSVVGSTIPRSICGPAPRESCEGCAPGPPDAATAPEPSNST